MSKLTATITIQREGIEFPVEVTGYFEKGYSDTREEPGQPPYILVESMKATRDVWLQDDQGAQTGRLYFKDDEIEFDGREEDRAIAELWKLIEKDQPDPEALAEIHKADIHINTRPIKIHGCNLSIALAQAIEGRRKYEREELEYTSDSALIGGWAQLKEAIDQGRAIEFYPVE